MFQKKAFCKWFLTEKFKFIDSIVDSNKGKDPEFVVDGDYGVLTWYSIYDNEHKIEMPLCSWKECMNGYFEHVGYNGECLDFCEYDKFSLFKAFVLNRSINGIFEKID